MATTENLMGNGMSAALAGQIGLSPVAVSGAGTSSGTATAIKGFNVKILGTTSQTGGILGDTSVFPIGAVAFIACDHSSTASAVIYPPSGATITNGSSVTVAADKNMIVWRYSNTIFFHVILA